MHIVRPSALRWLPLWLLALAGLAQDLPAQSLAPIPELDGPVVDTTGTLPEAERRALEQRTLALQQRTGSQLQILVVPTTKPETIEQYAVRVFEQWRLGRKGVDDGVLLVVATTDRKVRIEVGYGLEGAIPDITAGRIIREYLVPKFRAGDYAGGISDASARLVDLIEGEPLPPPDKQHDKARGDVWITGLVAAFFVGSLLGGLLRSMPTGPRALVTGVASGGVAWLISAALLIGGMGALVGLGMGLFGSTHGRFVRHSNWGGFGGGGGPWMGGGGGGFGGGWGGGGGSSGGGGASGSW